MYFKSLLCRGSLWVKEIRSSVTHKWLLVTTRGQPRALEFFKCIHFLNIYIYI